jgi:hypothetical protein
MVCVLVVGLGLVEGSSVRIQADTYATKPPTYPGTCTGYSLGNTQGSNIDSNVVSSDSASNEHGSDAMSNSFLLAPHGNITMSNSLRASLLGFRDVLVLDASVGCLDASGLEKHVLPWTKSGKLLWGLSHQCLVAGRMFNSALK